MVRRPTGQPTTGENHDWGGRTEHEKGRIALRHTPGRSEDSMRETLLHEITHAVWAVRGLNHNPKPADDDETEEYIVTCQTAGLLEVLAENPHVVAYLTNVGRPA